MGRIAVITPYFREPTEMLLQAHESVLGQGVPADHFLIADGFPNPEVSNWKARHVTLPQSHGDNGMAARGIGGLLAEAEGYDFIAYLDADNWFHAGHLASLLELHRLSGAEICASFRTFHSPQGADLEISEPDEDRLLHVDTSALLLARAAFGLAGIWLRMPVALGPICDRVFLCAARRQRLRVVSTMKRTLAFRSQYEFHYRLANQPPPENVKPVNVLAPCLEYLHSRQGIDECFARLGFWPGTHLRGWDSGRHQQMTFQRILAELFSTRAASTIVQVGANDGRINDPLYDVVQQFKAETRILLIEPQPEVLPHLGRNYADHPGALVRHAAIGRPPSLVLYRVKPALYDSFIRRHLEDSPAYRVPSGFTSSVLQHVVEHVRGNLPAGVSPEDAIEAIEVPCGPLLPLLEATGWQAKTLEVLQVDTEGMDDEVILSCGVDVLRPVLIGFEHSHLPDHRLQALHRQLDAWGYRLYRWSGGDSLAVRRDYHSPMLESLEPVPAGGLERDGDAGTSELPALGQPFTYFHVLLEEPLVCVVSSGILMHAGLDLALGLARGAPCHVLVQPAWHIPAAAGELAAVHAQWRTRAPNLRLTFLCNTRAEMQVIRSLGLDGLQAHKSAFLDHRIFSPGLPVPRRHDAVHVASVESFKRHHLAWGVPNLALVTYAFAPDFDPAGITGYQHLSYANFDLADPRNIHPIPPAMVARIIRASGCGLILSEVEGANNASAEYLLCGVPVVTTPSAGGREELFDPRHVLVVDPRPGAVAAAVRHFNAANIDPREIRAGVMAKIRPHRRTLIEWLGRIAGRDLLAEADEDLWLPRFTNKLRRTVRLSRDPLS